MRPKETVAGGSVIAPSSGPVRSEGGLTGGGTEGNERLTAMTGALLIVLLAGLGITILRVGQLIWLHLFLGLVLLGPLAIKLASTGYRFARYYTREPTYREKGPPVPFMRLLAPLVVTSALVVFVTGVLLLGSGPSGRDQYLFLHKASFIVWLGVTALHVLGHLPEMSRSLRRVDAGGTWGTSGEAGRWIATASALAAGLVLAVVLIPEFAPWTAHGVLLHRHHD